MNFNFVIDCITYASCVYGCLDPDNHLLLVCVE